MISKSNPASHVTPTAVHVGYGGPAVLGDPSQWPGESACLEITVRTLRGLIDDGVVKAIDAEAAGRLVNGAALSAALWIAAAKKPSAVLPRARTAFRALVSGLLR